MLLIFEGFEFLARDVAKAGMKIQLESEYSISARSAICIGWRVLVKATGIGDRGGLVAVRKEILCFKEGGEVAFSEIVGVRIVDPGSRNFDFFRARSGRRLTNNFG